MAHVGLLGVEHRQGIDLAAGDALDEAQEDLTRGWCGHLGPLFPIFGVVTPKLRSGHSAFNPTADRRDNRSRILDAADHVFGAAGAAGSTEDVAALAGVGIATVFRHFPTKQD